MKSEVLRYLGYSKSNQLPDQSTAILIKSCLEEMLEIQQVKSTYRFFELAKADKQLNVSGTNLTLTSRYTTASSSFKPLFAHDRHLGP